MDEQDAVDLEALVQDEIEQAVHQAEAGLLPISEVGSEAEGGRYREMVRQVGDTTYIVRIFEGDEDEERQSLDAAATTEIDTQVYQPVLTAGTVVASSEGGQHTVVFVPSTAEAGTEVYEPEPKVEESAEAVDIVPAYTNNTAHVSVSTLEQDRAGTEKNTMSEKPAEVIEIKPTTPIRSRRTIRKPARLLEGIEDPLEVDRKLSEKVVKMPKVTCSNLDVEDLFIEVEVERDLFVSHLEREESGKNMYIYKFRISSKEFQGAFPHEESVDKPVKETTKTKTKTPAKKMVAQHQSTPGNVSAESGKGKKGRPRKVKSAESVQKTAKSTPDKQTVKAEEVEQLVNETKKDDEVEKETTDDITESEQTENKTTSDGVTQTVKSEEELAGTDMEGYEEMSAKPDGTSPVKRKSSPDPGDSDKKKRKYTRRNAYSQDDNNYTVRKNEDGEPVYKCNICGVEMRWPGNMRDHLRTHTRDCPFICTHCGKGFTNQANYNHHVPIHSDKRPYICDICGFSFKIKRSLTTHYRRHVSSGNHVCQICGKRFHSSTEVNKHTVLHTGERNYECKVCGKKFKQGSALYRHKFTHSVEGKHVCQACGVSFGRKDYYRTHLLKNHGDLIGKEDWVDEVLNSVHMTPAMMKKEKEVVQVEHRGPQVIQYEIVDSDGHRYEAQIENLDVPIANSEIEIATNKITFVLSDGTIQ